MKRKDVFVKSDEINHVCDECGIEANRLTCFKKYGKTPKQRKFEISCYHLGYCDCCGEYRKITEVRDFFYPNFELLNKIKKPKLSDQELEEKRKVLLKEMEK